MSPPSTPAQLFAERVGRPNHGDDLCRDAATRLRGRPLVLARRAWAIAALLVGGLFVASLPPYYDQLRTICIEGACANQRLTPERGQALQNAGVSVDFYAAYVITLAILFAGVCFAIAATIVWRAASERLALLAALGLVLFGAVFPGPLGALMAAYPDWSWPLV